MEEEQQSLPTSPISSSQSSSSSSSTSPSHIQEEEEDDDQGNNHQEQLFESNSYIPNLTNPSPPQLTGSEDDTRSCIVVLLTFWCFASIASILGFYGDTHLQLGPNCSRLLSVNSLLVNEIMVEQLSGPNNGLMLYGFHTVPKLDAETNWSETHRASIGSNSHKEWVYYLNKGSEVNIDYRVWSRSSSPLYLVIAQGEESFSEWIDDPAHPNRTLSWNVFYGSGMVQQKIFKSSYYYIAVGNLITEDVKVKLKFSIHAFMYNTSEAHSNCSLAHGICGFKLFFLGSNAAVLTSPAPEKHRTHDWYVKLSYEPRWISYFVGSGAMTILMVLGIRLCNKVQSTRRAGVGFRPSEVDPERTPLLLQKEYDASSLGSSYDSVSHDDEDAENLSLETKSLQGDNSHHRRLCVICFDAPRDCFFLPCGHCAACFACGTRIVEEAGICPICRRKMKKVRKIFTV